MCGRFTLTRTDFDPSQFGVDELPLGLKPRYNLAPTQEALVILNTTPRHAALGRFGLIPAWAIRDGKLDAFINARAETALKKPAFRDAFRRRRCLVVADGFYEWRRQGNTSQPFYFRLKDGQVFGIASIYNIVEFEDFGRLPTFAILTVEANELVRSVHHRMPAIVPPELYDLWLDPAPRSAEDLQQCLRPFSSKLMEGYAVSKLVNSVRNEGPELIRPLSTSVLF